jgi:hypothetical protein
MRNSKHSHLNTYKWNEDKIVYKDKCFECDSTENIHYHHILPEIRGGKKTIPLCVICHGLVHDRNFDHYRELQRIGIERAKLEGKFTGRKPDSKETVETFLNKVKVKMIIELLNDGYGPRHIMRAAKCGPNLVYKVKEHLDKLNP